MGFSSEGRVTFRVVVETGQVPMARFATAVFRTFARVSHTKRLSPKKWQALVWLKTTKIAEFRSLCIPVEFELTSTREILRNPQLESEET